MTSRAHAKLIRQYLKNGGEVYPGLCRVGSYWIHQLHLEQDFVKDEVPNG